MELWHYRTLRFNLIVLMICWMACSFGFYMLAYVLKYLQGSIFLNAYASSFAEIVGKTSTMLVLKCASLKRVFLISFGLSLLGIVLLIILSQNDQWIPLMLLLAKFGLSQAFVVSYLSIVLLYPTILSSTAMGICNLLARVSTIMSPLVTEVRSPLNLLILFIIVGVAFLASQCLILPQKETEKIKNDD